MIEFAIMLGIVTVIACGVVIALTGTFMFIREVIKNLRND